MRARAKCPYDRACNPGLSGSPRPQTLGKGRESHGQTKEPSQQEPTEEPQPQPPPPQHRSAQDEPTQEPSPSSQVQQDELAQEQSGSTSYQPTSHQPTQEPKQEPEPEPSPSSQQHQEGAAAQDRSTRVRAQEQSAQEPAQEPKPSEPPSSLSTQRAKAIQSAASRDATSQRQQEGWPRQASNEDARAPKRAQDEAPDAAHGPTGPRGRSGEERRRDCWTECERPGVPGTRQPGPRAKRTEERADSDPQAHALRGAPFGGRASHGRGAENPRALRIGKIHW